MNILNKLIMKGSDGNKSLTATVFFVGSLVCFVKLLLSGMTIKGFEIPVFSGAEFALVMSALGGIYTLRRSKVIQEDKKVD